MPLIYSWKYAFLRRFPIFLRTKWGKRFCDCVIEELGLVKSTRQDLEYQKLLWQPYRNELEDWKQRRGFVDQILDREVEKMFPGFQSAAKPQSDKLVKKDEADKTRCGKTETSIKVHIQDSENTASVEF